MSEVDEFVFEQSAFDNVGHDDPADTELLWTDTPDASACIFTPTQMIFAHAGLTLYTQKLWFDYFFGSQEEEPSWDNIPDHPDVYF